MSRLQKDSTIPSVASTSQEDQESRTLKVTLLSSEWKSSTDGDLSTINRELAIQLAKHPNVDVCVLLPNYSGEDRSSAESHNVKLIEADKTPGVEPVLQLSSPPRDHTMDCVIGHGVHLGRLIPLIKKNPNYSHCKWIQVVHSALEGDGMYKNISEGEKMQKTEIQLCKMADQVITIGPKLAEDYKRYLRPAKQEENVFDLTPSIFSEFLEVEQATEERKTFCILVIGSGDSCEDFNVKGYDIATKAIAELKDESYKLKFVCPAGGKGDIADKLLHHGISHNQLIIRSFDDSREVLADLFCEVDLAIMPSRTEGFGIKALEALSAGLPVLVSGNSGLGEALKQVLLGSQSVVDSEDPKDWAREIKRVRQKKREVRLSESSLLREKYLEKYTWEVPCKSLVIKMKKLIFGGNEQVIRNLQQWQQNASRYKNSSNTDPLSGLEKIASEKGYKISDNQGSGNCLFYALSEQLETVKGVKIHHFELRRSLVQYLREHPKQVDGTDLFHFVDRHTTWGGYLTGMEQDGTWGDHVILWAAANCYQIAIHVISSLPGRSEVIIKPDCPFDVSKYLVLGHVHEVHYVSLQPLQETRATTPGRDKRPASVCADQPRKQFRKELTNHDYCEGDCLAFICRLLKNEYKRRSQLKPLFWDNTIQLPLEDVYTRLKILHRRKRDFQLENTEVNVSEIFKNGDDIIVLVEGSPGIGRKDQGGKTSTSNKILSSILDGLWHHQLPNFVMEQAFNIVLSQQEPHCSVCSFFSKSEDNLLVHLRENLHKPLSNLTINLTGLTEKLSVPKVPEICFMSDDSSPESMSSWLDKKFTTDTASPLLRCASCKLLVHASCYGVSHAPSDGQWKCQRCLQDDQSAIENSYCSLCRLGGGALKRTTDSRWVHIGCAVAVPEVFFVDVNLREGVNIDKITSARRKLKCFYCRSSSTASGRENGACVQCCAGKCAVSFHVTCFVLAGFVLEPSDWPQPTEIYCERHLRTRFKGKQRDFSVIHFGESVVAKHKNGRYYRGVVQDTTTDEYYVVSFDDGTYCDNLPPTDIVGHDSTQEDIPVGRVVQVRWSEDGGLYKARVTGRRISVTYQVEFEDESWLSVRREDVYKASEELPLKVQQRLSSATETANLCYWEDIPDHSAKRPRKQNPRFL